MNTPINEAVELLPCPFCGGPVALERAHQQNHEHLGQRQFWGVKCRNTINLGGTCAIEQVPSASPEAAITRWNRRAPLPPPIVEPVAYADPQAFANFASARVDGSKGAGYSREWMWANSGAGLVPLYTTPASAPSDGAADARDSARLDFVLKNSAWVQWVRFDDTFTRAQLWTQNEDEEYVVLSGEGKSYSTQREAIDAAIASTHTTTGGENE